jgi:hypothetical protein
MSANHVERHVLACGFSVERIRHDYGTDLLLFTYNNDGEIESGYISLQLKATDDLRVSRRLGHTIPFVLKRADLEAWLYAAMPFILVVYDAKNDKAYWLYVQDYFETMPGFDLTSVGKTLTVHLPMESVLDASAIRSFARFRDDVLEQMRGVIRHHDR